MRHLESLLERNPKSKSLKRLLREKRLEESQIKERLPKEINEKYEKSFEMGLTLNGKFLFPVYREFNPRVLFWAINAIPFFGNIATVLSFGGMKSFEKNRINGKEIMNILKMPYEKCTNYYDEHKKCFARLKKFKRLVKNYSSRLFSNCSSAGCSYFIVEEYKHWIKTFSETINQDLLFLEGLRLEKIDVASMKKVHKRIDEMANHFNERFKK